MFRGRYSRGGSNSKPRTTLGTRGLFADGTWHCDCSPRLPAEHFKVKKEGKNQGRWFYTCQNSEPKRCPFFLWDEDAKVREEGAVLNNSRTEPGKQTGWDARRTALSETNGERVSAGTGSPTPRRGRITVREDSPPPPYSLLGSKRTATAAGFSEDDEEEEFFSWPSASEEERDMAKLAESSTARAPQTPRKASKTGVYATPAQSTAKKRTLPWLEEEAPQTPTTPVMQSRSTDNYFNAPSKPPTSATAALPAQSGPATPHLAPPTPAAKSPSPPSRHRDALVKPADSSSSLTSEVLAILSSASLPPPTISALRSVLSKHDLRTQGVVRGRDITRLALKAKDAKIAELQARIASLEAEREVERAVTRQRRRTVRFDDETTGA